MRFFADENIARALVAWARASGDDVMYAAEIRPGESDTAWLREAESQQRLILTSDKDFGELVFRDRLNSHGIVLLRLDELSMSARIARLRQAWPVVQANTSGKFVVITPGKVRVRALRLDETPKQRPR
jgi:predicted nuclease of predicted toxin-antitoxin system